MIPEHIHYWRIEHVWAFYIIACLAVAVFVFGLKTHVSVWLKCAGHRTILFSWRGLFNLFWDGLLGRRIFKGDIAAGTMHLFILWGFLGLFAGTVIIAADYWIYPFLKGALYLWYSTCLEILGLLLFIGLAWAMIRRYVQRVPRLERNTEDLIPVFWLFLVVASGFLVEGLGLAARKPEWAGFSFAGYWVSFLFSNTERILAVYPYLWWTHAVVSLGFIAAIPYCKLFHILAAPAGIYLEPQPEPIIRAETRKPDEEIFSFRDMVFMDACTRCGRCVEVCPSAGAGEPFSPRDFIRWSRNNLLSKYYPKNYVSRFSGLGEREKAEDELFTAQKIWRCTTCRACLEVCPVYVSTPDIIRGARTELVEDGTQVPPLLVQTLEKLYKYNNPWEASKKNRTKWSGDEEITDLVKDKGAEGLCYFVGCTTALDTRARDLALSFAGILRHAGIPFGTLGKKEPCCGDIARRVGETGLFEDQMEKCLRLFDKHSIGEVVTSSPHCFNVFKNEYPAYQALKPREERVNFQVRHYSQILNRLLKDGSIHFEKSLNLKVTYHDPCYLGRYNRVFDEPRQVIEAIPGIKFVEMEHNREDSLCCGGGGGRMWQEDLDAKTKMSEIRIKEAEVTGAGIVVTACPLCLIMLEDARKTTGLEESIQVMDLNELVALALDLKSQEGK